MPDQPDELEELLKESDDDTELVKRLRGLVKAKDAELKTANGELLETKRGTVFSQVGIDPAKGMGKLFAETYKGELTAEAVREAAKEYDLIKETTNAGSREQSRSGDNIGIGNPDVDAFNIGREVSVGSAGNFEGEDPAAFGREVYRETYQKTGNTDEAMAAMFGAKLAATIDQGQRR
jgi:hypothetical protein